MLTSLAFTFLLGLFLGFITLRLKLPTLLGLILTGIILGPYGLNQLSSSLMGISVDLRQVALVVILMRAGLSLNLKELKKAGRPAVLLCFVPACFEIAGIMWLGPHLFSISLIEAGIIGAVVGAVSPAIIVPKMLGLMEEGYGTQKSIPQMIMAGGSVDDVFVIVIFTAFTGLMMGKEVSIMSIVNVPISIVLGLTLGLIVGWLLTVFFKRFHMRDTIKVILLLSIAFLVIELEHDLKEMIPIAGLLAVMSIGIMIYRKYNVLAVRISPKFNKLWVAAEILLFVLVGAEVNIDYVLSSGVAAVVLVLGGLVFRMLGVFICVLGTNLTLKERLFCMVAYLPKATVQAAIGSLPLAWGLKCGELALTVAVLAILITAPLGAFLIDFTYKKLLNKEQCLALNSEEKEEEDLLSEVFSVH